MDAPPAASVSAALLRQSLAYDYDMLRHGMVVYDALYRLRKEGKQETHTWNPEAYR